MTTVIGAEQQAQVQEGEGACPGFKRTEIGFLPDDWEMHPLHHLAQIATGSTPPTNNRTYYGDEFLFVSPADLRGEPYVFRSEKNLSTAGFAIARKFPKGSVLFTCIGSTIGKCGIASVELTSNQQINALFPSQKFVSEYLYYALCHLALTIRQLAGTQAVPLINKTQFAGTRVPVPKYREQQVIAAALSDVDEQIGALEKLIAKKRMIKLATMQQLLTGKTRLPGFAKESTSYRQTEAGKIPIDWEAVPLGELFTYKNGLNKAKEYFGFGTPIVNYMDVYRQSGLYSADLMGRVSLSQAEISNFAVQKGDVFFTRTSETVDEIGVASVMLDESRDTVFSGFVLRARPRNARLDDQYKRYCFSTVEVRKQIISKSTYTTRALTNGRLLSAVSIPLPTLEEQKAIASTLSEMDSEIAALERRRDKTKAIKQGMMQVLLTGRIRLVKPGAQE